MSRFVSPVSRSGAAGIQRGGPASRGSSVGGGEGMKLRLAAHSGPQKVVMQYKLWGSS